jgi:membrane-bound ClpP family serine protease
LCPEKEKEMIWIVCAVVLTLLFQLGVISLLLSLLALALKAAVGGAVLLALALLWRWYQTKRIGWRRP